MFNHDFWIAIAALIPALWLTAGLATGAVAALFDHITATPDFALWLKELQEALPLKWLDRLLPLAAGSGHAAAV